MKLPFLSIVIPAYNCQQTIKSLLSSVIKSEGINLKEVEVIIVDDKSKDRTLNVTRSICSKIKRRLNSIKLTTLEENSGPAKARNVESFKGTRAARLRG